MKSETRYEHSPYFLIPASSASLCGVLCSVLIFFVGCSSRPPDIPLPPTLVLAVSEQHIVVIPPVVRLYRAPDLSAPIAMHQRRGDVALIVRFNGDSQWVEIETELGLGWIQAQDIEVFRSRQQADNRRRTLIGAGDHQ